MMNLWVSHTDSMDLFMKFLHWVDRLEVKTGRPKLREPV
jgi:hypothetical protein